MSMFHKSHECPLCNGTGFIRVEHNDDEHHFHFTRCDHTYLMFRDRVIATGDMASLMFGALLALPFAPVMLIIWLLTK